MAVVLCFEGDALRLICGHAPPSGISWEESDVYDALKREWDMHSAYTLIVCLGDFNGHMDRHFDGLGVHGGYGVDQRNFEGRILLEFCLERKLC